MGDYLVGGFGLIAIIYLTYKVGYNNGFTDGWKSVTKPPKKSPERLLDKPINLN